MTALTLFLCIGATLRLWRVYELDVIGEPLRKLADKAPDGGFATFLGCVYCLGFWLSVGVVGSALLWADTWGWQLLCASLTVSYLLGQLHTRLEEDA